MTAADRDRLTLRVGSTEYRGWESVSVSRDLEEAAASFALEVSGEQDVTPDAACEVRIGSDLVVTGIVDSVRDEVSGDSASTSVGGRSRTGQLVKNSCIASPAQFKEQTIVQIARALAAPYGVEVVCSVSGLLPLRRWSYETGEKVFEAIERLAREQALLVVDDPQGRLVLTRVADPLLRYSDLVMPGNVKRAARAVDVSERYSEVRVKAQRSGDDRDYGRVVAGVKGLAEDDGVRFSVLVLKGEKAMDAGQAAQRAAWEAATRWGKSVSIEVDVASWRDDLGRIWQPNVVAHTTIPRLGIDADLLVVSVNLTRSGSGRLATLGLGLPDGYVPEPPKTRRAARGKTGVALLDREVPT